MRTRPVLLGSLGAAVAIGLAPVAGADPAAPEPRPDVAAEASVGTPHLASPENLPPGATSTPPPEGRGLGYLRDLWHAVQTQEVSGADALLLLTQRPMNPDAYSPRGLPAGPQPAPPPAPAPSAVEVPPSS
ncbi:dopamine receptor D4 [[Mycobacterium] wendilense]|uniref:Dopamine receptor D4 n=1 Tax=[Mycobacterium] wendilense TaxID=3064284 RepID=A0ABN9P242_9MYCO|nr:dopamine receptor D4 [Mycolicibacterium sp. MU0050]CAJ1582729.1 dopamine receptor D4 [Mycolicibacterium sp. MU0050]